MKHPLPLTLLVLALALPARADDNLAILDVGLNGYYTPGLPTSILLRVRNPQPQAQALQLDVEISTLWRDTVTVTDIFSQSVEMGAGEQREVELPILAPYGNLLFEVSAHTTSGGVAGSDRWDSAKLTAAGGPVVALLCTDEKLCQSAQSQIEFSGTINERADKNRQLKFMVIRQGRSRWWPYTAANTIVVATPILAFTREQRSALEIFARRGGRLVLLEKESADADFLAAYRQGTIPPSGTPISRGRLYRVASLNSQTLGNAFAGAALAEALHSPGVSISFSPFSFGDVRGLRRQVATTFTFPRLRWLLLWLGVYILIVGPASFAVLSWLRRLEWGWVSICAVALLFAAGFYISSSAKRPKQFALDNLAIYYLDSQSGQAFAEYGLRVSAPERRELTLLTGDEAVLTSAGSGADSDAHLAVEIRDQRGPRLPWQVQLGPPLRLEFPLLRWGFRDFDLEGPHELAGTVREIAAGRLRNDTGQQFEQAVYVDTAQNALWRLGPLGPGAEIALADAQRSVLRPTEKQQQGQLTVLRPAAGQLSLPDLARFGALPPSATRVFYGVTQGPRLPAELPGIDYRPRHWVMLVVVFE